MNEKIELGDNVESKITGFIGIVTGRCEYLHGNTRCYVNPKIGKNNKINPGAWMDEGSLKMQAKPE